MKKILIFIILLLTIFTTSCNYINKMIGDFKSIKNYDESLESVYSIDELVEKYNKLIVDYQTTISLNIKFDYSSVNELIKTVDEKSIKLFNSTTKFNEKSGVLTIEVKYEPFAVESTDDPGTIIQNNMMTYTSVNGFTRTRSDDFNDFKINKRENTYLVNNSESLYYVMTKGYNPIIDESNTSLVNLYNQIKDISRNIINDNMDDFTKCLVIYEYLINNIRYDKQLLELGRKESDTTKYDGYYLEGAVFNHKCVCSGFAKLYACLCALEDIPCAYITGKSATSNEGHAWNKVCIDGTWYIVDVTSGGTSVNSNIYLNHYYFLISDITYLSRAIEDIQNDEVISCPSDFNIYDYFKFNNHSLELNSYIEALTLFQALLLNKALNKKQIIIDVKFNYSLTNDNIADELQKLMSDLHMYEPYSYVKVNENKKVYIIVI